MIGVNDIKNGMTLIIEGNIYQVIEFLHVKPGKGSAFMKTKLRNLRTGGIVEKTFNTNVKFEKANINKMNSQYLYSMGDTYYFMNMETYEHDQKCRLQVTFPDHRCLAVWLRIVFMRAPPDINPLF